MIKELVVNKAFLNCLSQFNDLLRKRGYWYCLSTNDKTVTITIEKDKEFEFDTMLSLKK